MNEKNPHLLNKSIFIPLLVVGLIFIGFAYTLSSAKALNQSTFSNTTSLIISYRSNSNSLTSWFSVACSGKRTIGTHPNKKNICKFLQENKTNSEVLFLHIPQNMMCTQIYGGSDVATIAGTYNGRKVATHYSRTDGCTSSRWLQAAVFFTFPGYQVISGDISVSPTCPGPVKIGQGNCINPSATGDITFTKVDSPDIGSAIKIKAFTNSGFSALIPYGSWNISTLSPYAMHCTPILLKTPLEDKANTRLSISCDTGMR